MIPMLAALLALSTPLAGQSGGQHARGGRGAWVLGFAGTLGGGWQVEAADVGYARVVAAGPLRIATLSARIGSFIDEGAIIGGSRGFLAGLTLGGRTKPVRLADLGTETSTSEVGGDLAIEATGYVGANSPLPQGSAWGGVSLLPGVWFGDVQGFRIGLLFGPTVYFGRSGDVRPFLGLRFEAPLARRER
ncbi:MAG TPA: hypothetical protein VIW28_04125 [Gemmatimonadales bacterium]